MGEARTAWLERANSNMHACLLCYESLVCVCLCVCVVPVGVAVGEHPWLSDDERLIFLVMHGLTSYVLITALLSVFSFSFPSFFSFSFSSLFDCHVWSPMPIDWRARALFPFEIPEGLPAAKPCLSSWTGWACCEEEPTPLLP